MKKILISIMIIAVVAAIAIGGTVAYFSATSNDVTSEFGTATVGLKAGGDGWVTKLFDVKNAVPGQSFTRTAYVQNLGTAPLYIHAEFAPDATQDRRAQAIDHAITISFGQVSGATEVVNHPGVFLIAGGATASIPVTLLLRDEGDQTQAIAGGVCTYNARFVGTTTAP